MLEKIKQWYTTNTTEITWFIIGLLTWTGLDSLASRNYGYALFCFAIAYLNFAVRKFKP